MSDSIEIEKTLAEQRQSWSAAMEALTDEQGYFQSVGKNHFALFIDESPTLLVTFESLDDVLAREDRMPRGYDLAKAQGWSMLTLFSDGPTWFRDASVYSFFDRQVDDAFFEDFDQVLFFGAGIAAHAACAYAVTAPGAQVLALNPRATLSTEIAGWDKRNLDRRRLDFTKRFGYAPDMLDGVAKAVVVHDPSVAEDAMQATLFRAPHILRLSAPLLGDDLVEPFTQMNILRPMIEAAMAGHLTRDSFAKLLRKRRNYAPYLNSLLSRAASKNRLKLQIMICQSAVARLKSNRFAKRLARLQDAQAEQG